MWRLPPQQHRFAALGPTILQPLMAIPINFDEKRVFIDAVQKGQNRASGVAASAVGVSNNTSGAGSNAVVWAIPHRVFLAVHWVIIILHWVILALQWVIIILHQLLLAVHWVLRIMHRVFLTAVGSNNVAVGYVSSAFGHGNLHPVL